MGRIIIMGHMMIIRRIIMERIIMGHMKFRLRIRSMVKLILRLIIKQLKVIRQQLMVIRQQLKVIKRLLKIIRLKVSGRLIW